ncbi:MAG: hypothetical protein MZV64_35190 [Ignavibacteriales bacterium]|nr:hypothetical protein [Ignavibacteriales bacterium]
MEIWLNETGQAQHPGQGLHHDRHHAAQERQDDPLHDPGAGRVSSPMRSSSAWTMPMPRRHARCAGGRREDRAGDHREDQERKQGIHGLHIMPVGWEDIVPRIVRRGAEFLKPRDQPSLRVKRSQSPHNSKVLRREHAS